LDNFNRLILRNLKDKKLTVFFCESVIYYLNKQLTIGTKNKKRHRKNCVFHFYVLYLPLIKIVFIKVNKNMKYECTVCGWIYDPAIGDPDGGIAPGTSFEDIPDDWVCPLCGVSKEDFEPVED